MAFLQLSYAQSTVTYSGIAGPMTGYTYNDVFSYEPGIGSASGSLRMLESADIYFSTGLNFPKFNASLGTLTNVTISVNPTYVRQSDLSDGPAVIPGTGENFTEQEYYNMTNTNFSGTGSVTREFDFSFDTFLTMPGSAGTANTDLGLYQYIQSRAVLEVIDASVDGIRRIGDGDFSIAGHVFEFSTSSVSSYIGTGNVSGSMQLQGGYSLLSTTIDAPGFAFDNYGLGGGGGASSYSGYDASIQYTYTPVPELSTSLLASFSSLLLFRRKRVG